METPAPKKSSRIVKYIRRTVFLLVALVTLGALIVAEENWRGVHAWTNYKKELEAKGEHFDIASVVPRSVPDEHNLAKIPFFTENFILSNVVVRHGPQVLHAQQVDDASHLPADVELPRRTKWRFGFSSDLTNWAQAYGKPTSDPAKAADIVLEELNTQEPLLAELKTAGNRTQFRLDFDYDHWADNTNVQSLILETFGRAKQFTRVLSLKAEAELAAGQTDQALEDIGLLCRGDKGLLDGPLLISQLVGFACVEITLQPVAQGLIEHRWTDAQLKQLQELLGQFDLLASSTKSIRGERNICTGPYFNSHFLPLRGWDRMEEVNLNHVLEDSVMPCINPTAQRIDLSAVRSCQQLLQNLTNAGPVSIVVVHHTFVASSSTRSYPRVFVKTAYTQTSVSEVLVAVALERCKLAEGKYPESLAALVPRYAATLPHDVITGRPLVYRTTAGGNFILYSVGWNGTDDGGKTVFTKSAKGIEGAQDREQGDWVFQYPD